MDHLNLYTLQNEKTLFELENKGRITNKEIYLKLHLGAISDHFIEQYRTFTQMADKRLSKPEDVDFAIWCGTTREGTFKAEKGQVIYAMSVPADEVLYFDGRKWDYVLNGIYLPTSGEDQDTFQKDLERRGIRSQYGFLSSDAGRMNPDIAKRIKKSWERIFTINDWDDIYIQASIWEIRKEWVRHVVRPGEDLFEKTGDLENTFPPRNF